MKKIVSILLICIPTILYSNVFNISNYGAVADGITVNTKAIQKAIDECTKTGGTVLINGGGVYITGTIYLKDNVHLKIKLGTTLKGSGNIFDYTTDTHKQMYKYERSLDRCLIFAKNAENIVVSGNGKVDGNVSSFPNKDDEQHNRPMLFRFLECKNIKMKNLYISHMSSWASAWLYCSNIVVDGVTVDCSFSNTSDCLDFDGCSDVRVSNCNLIAADDCLSLQSSSPDKPCRDITITNCTFTSKWDALRIGLLSRGNIENVTVSNCTFKEVGHVGIQFELCEGGNMGNMVFNNLTMDNVRVPIFMGFFQQRVADDAPMEMAPMGTMKGFIFSNITCKFEKVHPKCPAFKEGVTPKNSLIYLSALPNQYIEDVFFNNIQLETNGGASKKDFENSVVRELNIDYLKDWWAGIYKYDNDGTIIPANGFYARHIKGLYMNNVNMSTRHKDERPSIVLDDVKNFNKSGLFKDGKPVKRKDIHIKK
jgi:polygalacturonase